MQIMFLDEQNEDICPPVYDAAHVPQAGSEIFLQDHRRERTKLSSWRVVRHVWHVFTVRFGAQAHNESKTGLQILPDYPNSPPALPYYLSFLPVD